MLTIRTQSSRSFLFDHCYGSTSDLWIDQNVVSKLVSSNLYIYEYLMDKTGCPCLLSNPIYSIEWNPYLMVTEIQITTLDTYAEFEFDYRIIDGKLLNINKTMLLLLYSSWIDK